jgi:hypothetical protein
MAHLKWTWAIALGYAASIWAHFLINGDKFTASAEAAAKAVGAH